MKSPVWLFLALMSFCGGHAQSQDSAQAVTSLPATKAGASVSIPDNGYVIAPADMLTVAVWKEPTLTGDLLVRSDGKISMPLLGDIPAAGNKPMELAAQITEQLKKFMKDPEVSVVVAKAHDNLIYLLGEVGKKGPVVMPPGMTLLAAISSGGGLTDFANRKKIYILRNFDGKQQKIPVNYKKALDGDSASNLALMPGDTIVVP